MAGWTGVLFNSTDLSTLPGVEIFGINHHKRPANTASWQKLIRRHGKKLTNKEYAERLIVISGVITGGSRALYETNRDNFFGYLEPTEATLRIPQSGGNRDYICTVDDIDFDDDPEGGLAKYTIKFVASNPPFGLDTSNTTDTNTTRTGASATETFVKIGGNITACPLITVTLTSGSGLTSSKYIKIMNPTSGKYITITRDWTAGDVLVIDTDAKTCKVNGVAVDYTGVFPTWEPSDTQIYREDNFTTRNITVNMVHKKRWL